MATKPKKTVRFIYVETNDECTRNCYKKSTVSEKIRKKLHRAVELVKCKNMDDVVENSTRVKAIVEKNSRPERDERSEIDHGDLKRQRKKQQDRTTMNGYDIHEHFHGVLTDPQHPVYQYFSDENPNACSIM